MLFNRQWWWRTLLVLAGITLFVRLGIWQLDRLAQRRATNIELRQSLAAPPLPLTGAPLIEDVNSLKDRTVIVHGQFDFGQQMILKVQNWQGRPGAHLITPLLIEGSEKAVLVDRGWIPDSESAVSRWPQFEEPGPVTVNGYVALSQTLSRQVAATAQQSEPQQEWYRVDIKAIQAQLPYQLLPFYIVQSPSPEGESSPPFRSQREIDLSEGPHLGYAIQWFLFSLVLAGGYVALLNKSASATTMG
jgi:surfeit locus 1 family protein